MVSTPTGLRKFLNNNGKIHPKPGKKPGKIPEWTLVGKSGFIDLLSMLVMRG
jgi:hypothetical protein